MASGAVKWFVEVRNDTANAKSFHARTTAALLAAALAATFFLSARAAHAQDPLLAARTTALPNRQRTGSAPY